MASSTGRQADALFVSRTADIKPTSVSSELPKALSASRDAAAATESCAVRCDRAQSGAVARATPDYHRTAPTLSAATRGRSTDGRKRVNQKR